MRTAYSRRTNGDRAAERTRWLAVGLALFGGLVAIGGALSHGLVLSAEASSPVVNLAVVSALGGAFGVLGCVAAVVACLRPGIGAAALLAAAGGLALTGFAVPAGLALLVSAVLIPVERDG